MKGCTGVIKNFLCVGNPDYFIEAENCHDMDFENVIAATEKKDVKLIGCKNMRFNFGGLDGFTEHKWEFTECDGIDIRNMFMSSARSACLIEKKSMNLTMSDCTLNWSDDVVDGLARIERIAINQCKRVKNMIGGFVYDRGEVIECKGVFRPEDNIEEWCGEEEDWKYYHFKNQDGPCTLKYNSGWREGNKIIVCDVNWFASLIMVSKRWIKGKVKIKVTRPRTRYGWDESKLHGAVVGWSDKMGPKVMKRIEDEWEGEVDGYLTLGACAYGAAGVEVEYWIDEIK